VNARDRHLFAVPVPIPSRQLAGRDYSRLYVIDAIATIAKTADSRAYMPHIQHTLIFPGFLTIPRGRYQCCLADLSTDSKLHAQCGQ
jgi:hypothetical protein